MQAAIYTRYGPPSVIQITELAKPTPKPNEVLLKICASSVNPLDCISSAANPTSSAS